MKLWSGQLWRRCLCGLWLGFFAVLMTGFSLSAQDRPSLAAQYSVETLAQVLEPVSTWHPWPTAGDRESWDALPAEIRRSLVVKAEQTLGTPWTLLPATLFLDYTRTGNRTRFQDESFARRRRLRDLVLAECIEHQGRFLDDIIDGVWAICEETYWGVPHHLSLQRQGRTPLPVVDEPTTDLFTGETAGLLAWTVYLLEPQLDAVTPLLCDRVRREVDRQVLTPCLERDDFWWMALQRPRHSNWTTWIDSNWLTAVLLLETDTNRRAQAAHKIMQSLDVFMADYAFDGGCEEGPGYWGHAAGALYESLELLHGVSKGAIDIFDHPLIRNLGRFIVHAHVADGYFINFADAHAQTHVEAQLVYSFGRRLGDDAMMSLAAFLAQGSDPVEFGGHLGRALPAIFQHNDLAKMEPKAPLLQDIWLSDIQVMTARTKAGTSQGFFIAAKGGHNAEDHNHNDVGNFMLYAGGRPVIIDVGVGPYTRENSTNRYGIWTMQSGYHNLPTINGVMQKEGRTFAARNVQYRADNRSTTFSLDIAGAYPPEAGVETWNRTFVLERDAGVRLTEAYTLQAGAREITLSLMTPCAVELQTGAVALSADGMQPVKVHYPAGQFTASVEDASALNPHVTREWGGRISRVLLTAVNPQQRGSWTLEIRQ